MEQTNRKQFLLRSALPCALGVAAAFIARWQLELSDGVSAAARAAQWPVYAPLNALTAFCLTLALFALLGRWSRATAISGAVFTVLSLVNHYTRDLHGSAVTPQDVLNLGTAAEVMGSYTLQITGRVVLLVLLYLPVLALAWAQARLAGAPCRATGRRRAGRVLGSAAAILAVLTAGYFGPAPLVPQPPCGWIWQEHYYQYGFLAGSVQAASLLGDPVIQPAGYTDEAAAEALAMADGYTPAAATDDYPDIVLILSESFYDFSLVTDLQADAEVLPVTGSLTNAVTGHTVVPHIGGGTNNSEYEMLTSNSLRLMPTVTPFNWLKLEGAASFASYLRELGYATLAAHPYTASNYRRDSAWQALGFDETHFQDSFPTGETYGDRPYQTDSATYRDLEALYEAMPADQPRFAFLVSIQSHGDYDMNDPSLDLVHAGADFGRYDAVMDEYLSCVAMSDAAVGELCDYFTRLYASTGRRVIVAMAGDHAPSFVDHVADKTTATESELAILERCTPFFIWANYPLENPEAAVNAADPLNRMDLCALAPTVAEQAGLPLTGYYRYLLAMKREVPVFTVGSDCLLADGTAARLGEGTAADRWMAGYFLLEYNNVGGSARRQTAFFHLP
ncbi:MAG: LTA synthase family protein [Gemmiger sp.]